MWLTAAVIPVTIVLGVLVVALEPLGGRSIVLVVAVLAAAGIVLTCAGLLGARARRR